MASTFRNKYRIDSHRMPEWDYSGNGLYFITLVTKERQCFFGRIDNVVMDLNQYGLIAQNEWSMSSIIRDEIVLWEFVVMPNHIHGIVQISVPDHDPLRVVETHGRDHLHVETHGRDHLHVETHGRDHLHVETHGRDHLHVETHGRVSLQQPPKQPPKQSTGRFIGSPRLPKSLSSFIAGYKSVVTTKINRLIIEKNGQIFTRNNRLWQRNFHDRVIRNLDEYRRIKSYIESNPMKW